GPGVINAVCGVATAQADRDPVVAITGQVPRGMRFKSYHQYLDTVGLFAPITKWSVGIEEPSTIPEVLANAFRVAARPRPGAVHVSIPSDVSRASTAAEPLSLGNPAPGWPVPGRGARPRRRAAAVGPTTGAPARRRRGRGRRHGGPPAAAPPGRAAGGLHLRGQRRGPARPARSLRRPRRLCPQPARRPAAPAGGCRRLRRLRPDRVRPDRVARAGADRHPPG